MISPDVLVIGGGPGGYVAAIRAAQLGLSTVCIEKERTLGGTCLREGCIPSKFILNVSNKYYSAKNELKALGISAKDVSYDFSLIQRKKGQVVTGLSRGIEFLLKKYKAKLITGEARITDRNTVIVGNTEFKPKNIVLATGSTVSYPKSFSVDERSIVTSKTAFEFKSPPKDLVVVGGGIIGLELGSVYNALGSNTTIIEGSQVLGGNLDADVSRTIQQILSKKGIKFMMSEKVQSISGNTVRLSNGEISAEKILVAVGRKPNLKGLERLEINSNGRVKVDKFFRTSIVGVYAIGDLVDGPMLAHKAEEEGIAVAEIIAGKTPSINKNAIPSVIYTSPEVATVGLSERDCKSMGIPYKSFKFPFQANSRARATLETAGFVKWICGMDGKVLGNQIIGMTAGESIMEGAIAIKNELSISQIAETSHPHPTLSEAIMEAAKGVFHNPIHL